MIKSQLFEKIFFIIGTMFLLTNQGQAAILYSQDFSVNPGYNSIISPNAGNGQVSWTGNAYSAKVYDQSSDWWCLGRSGAFQKFSANSDFTIEFDFNPVIMDWGSYPGIYFHGSDFENKNEFNTCNESGNLFGFTIVYSDSYYRKLRFFFANASGDNTSYTTKSVPADNEWYRVRIAFHSATSTADLLVEGPDGNEFFKADDVSAPISGIFQYLSIGEVGAGPAYGDMSEIKIDNILITDNTTGNEGTNQTKVRNLAAIYNLLLDDSTIKEFDFFEDFNTPTGWNLFLQKYDNWLDASQHQLPSVEWNDPGTSDLSGYQVEIVNNESFLRMKTEGSTYDRLKLMTKEHFTTGTYEWKVYFPNNMLEANGEGANTAYGAWLYHNYITKREIDFEVGWGPRWQRLEAGLSDNDDKLLVHMTVQPTDGIIEDWEQLDGQRRTKYAVIDSGCWYTFKMILSNQNGNYLVEWYFKKDGEEYNNSPAHVFTCPYGPSDTSFSICVSNENFPAIWLGENAPSIEPHHAKFDFVKYIKY